MARVMCDASSAIVIRSDRELCVHCLKLCVIYCIIIIYIGADPELFNREGDYV